MSDTATVTRLAPNVTTSVTNMYLETAMTNRDNLEVAVRDKTIERDELVRRAQQLNSEIEEIIVIQNTIANQIASLEKAKINGN